MVPRPAMLQSSWSSVILVQNTPEHIFMSLYQFLFSLLSQNTYKSNLKKEVLFWRIVWWGGYDSLWWGSHGGRNMDTLYTLRKQREMNQVLSSLPSQSGAAVHGIVLPTFRMGLPFPAKHFWKHPHRGTQRCVYLTILHSSELTLKSNSHGWVEFLFCDLH